MRSFLRRTPKVTAPPSHVLIMACSVTGEPWKAARHLSKQTENPEPRPGRRAGPQAPVLEPRSALLGGPGLHFAGEDASPPPPTPSSLIFVQPVLKGGTQLLRLQVGVRLRQVTKHVPLPLTI